MLALADASRTLLAFPAENIRRGIATMNGIRREVPALALGMGTAVGPVKG